MTSLFWQRRIDAAATEAEVVGLAREFLSALSPGDIARLPEACRPAAMTSGDDVVRYALTLVRHHCADDVASQRLVTRLASFFSAATVRLAHIG